MDRDRNERKLRPGRSFERRETNSNETAATVARARVAEQKLRNHSQPELSIDEEGFEKSRGLREVMRVLSVLHTPRSSRFLVH